ncbi:TetR/AcrR family transcriptional regulator [Nocardia sp. NBC_00565]|uniref:TetR/AcrR family transcriptional regulator n=1 Tax=Nocardia sp. NBC_00565 TaxID=2975993 RepID=UPI002E80A135|nr:TetR/AcrR family transcriptional regulator [Nocardia sp. NBC_00565]WUC05581.1 TetR/AcrR family transcriptional regulator [Nocardia sp. NBC_00565]
MADGGTPQQRMGALERREQILAVAAKHFEKRPYSEVSTAEIAKDAGVARPLINHYFGTKRDLYLEVLRRLSHVPPYVPAAAVRGIPADALEDRIRASVDHWLNVTWKHRSIWTSTIGIDTPSRDREIERILQQADEIAADRMLEALGLAEHEDYKRLHAMVLVYGGLAKAAGRQWLVHQSLTREEVMALLSQTLLTIVRDVAPSFRS